MTELRPIDEVAAELFDKAIANFDRAKHEEPCADRMFRSRIIRVFRFAAPQSLTLRDLQIIMKNAGYEWRYAEYMRMRTDGTLAVCDAHPDGNHLALKPSLL